MDENLYGSWCDAFGRCLVCGEPCTTGGCQNTSCSRGPMVLIIRNPIVTPAVSDESKPYQPPQGLV